MFWISWTYSEKNRLLPYLFDEPNRCTINNGMSFFSFFKSYVFLTGCTSACTSLFAAVSRSVVNNASLYLPYSFYGDCPIAQWPDIVVCYALCLCAFMSSINPANEQCLWRCAKRVFQAGELSVARLFVTRQTQKCAADYSVCIARANNAGPTPRGLYLSYAINAIVLAATFRSVIEMQCYFCVYVFFFLGGGRSGPKN